MEIFLIFMIILLLFGAKRLPDLFRSFGRSLGEFKKATREIEDEFREAMDDEKAAKKPAASRVPQPETPDSSESLPPEEEPARPQAETPAR